MFNIPALKTRLTVGLAVAGSALAVAPAAHATAADNLTYPPAAKPLGQSYSQVAANWQKFVLQQPAATNPLNDSTGKNCAKGQPTTPGTFWYLVGTGSGSVTRTCTVPVGRTIVIPIVNAFYGAFADDPADQRTEAFVRSQVNPVAQGATNLSASLDGSPITNPKGFYEQSTVFSATLPAGNLYGLPGGTVLSPSVDAGYYLAFYPLAPGKHTVKVAGTIGGTPINVTYNLTQSFLP